MSWLWARVQFEGLASPHAEAGDAHATEAEFAVVGTQ